jgi:acyl carrier protein
MQREEYVEEIVLFKTLLESLEVELGQGVEFLGLEFKKLQGWSSMKSLIMVVELEEKFRVLLTGEQVKEAKTFDDILKLVLPK